MLYSCEPSAVTVVDHLVGLDSEGAGVRENDMWPCSQLRNISASMLDDCIVDRSVLCFQDFRASIKCRPGGRSRGRSGPHSALFEALAEGGLVFTRCSSCGVGVGLIVFDTSMYLAGTCDVTSTSKVHAYSRTVTVEINV